MKPYATIGLHVSLKTNSDLKNIQDFSLVTNRRSGQKALPRIIVRDRKAGRSAYSEQSGSVEKVLAMEFMTESCLQVYCHVLAYS